MLSQLPQLPGESLRCSTIPRINSTRLVRILNGTANPYCSFCSASSRLALTFSAISKLILLWSRSALLRGVV